MELLDGLWRVLRDRQLRRRREETYAHLFAERHAGRWVRRPVGKSGTLLRAVSERGRRRLGRLVGMVGLRPGQPEIQDPEMCAGTLSDGIGRRVDFLLRGQQCPR